MFAAIRPRLSGRARHSLSPRRDATPSGRRFPLFGSDAPGIPAPPVGGLIRGLNTDVDPLGSVPGSPKISAKSSAPETLLWSWCTRLMATWTIEPMGVSTSTSTSRYRVKSDRVNTLVFVTAVTVPLVGSMNRAGHYRARAMTVQYDRIRSLLPESAAAVQGRYTRGPREGPGPGATRQRPTDRRQIPPPVPAPGTRIVQTVDRRQVGGRARRRPWQTSRPGSPHVGQDVASPARQRQRLQEPHSARRLHQAREHAQADPAQPTPDPAVTRWTARREGVGPRRRTTVPAGGIGAGKLHSALIRVGGEGAQARRQSLNAGAHMPFGSRPPVSKAKPVLCSSSTRRRWSAASATRRCRPASEFVVPYTARASTLSASAAR